MSIRHAAQPQFPLRGLREGPAAPWVRPADWLALPWIPDDEQAFVGLIAVSDTDHESITLWCQAAFTVDWGDGSSLSNQVSGGSLDHTYNFATLTSRVTSRGYKTAIVKITPQAGNNLTTVNLQYYPSGWGSLNNKSSPWLDIQINAAFLTAFVTGQSELRPAILERVHIRAHALTTLSGVFQSAHSLCSIPLFNTASITNIATMLYECDGVYELPLLDFSNVTTAANAFRFMRSISYLPPFNLSKLTDGTNLFSDNYALYEFPAMNLSSITNASYLFANNFAMRIIGAVNLSSVTNFGNWLSACGSIVRSLVTGVKVTHSYANCSLSATALNEIFTNLASGVTGQTITVTGNPGAGTCTPSIATAKGWTVVT